MGSGIQITNTVILGLMSIPLTIFALMTFLMYSLTGQLSLLVNFSILVFLLIWISSVIYFLLLIHSFKICNLENKSFKWAFYLNLTWIILLILFFLISTIYLAILAQGDIVGSLNSIDRVNNFSNMFSPILGIIYGVSFTFFLNGYLKSKR